MLEANAAPSATTESAPPAPAAPTSPPEVKASESGQPVSAPLRAPSDKIAAAVARIKAMEEAKPAAEAKPEEKKDAAPAKEKAEAKPAEAKADKDKEPEKEKAPANEAKEEDLAKDPKVAKTLAFIAKQEAAVKKREAEVSAQAEKYAAIEKAMDGFERDPVTAMRAMLKGDAKAQIALAEQLYIDAVGDKDLPAEAKARRETMALRREVEALRRSQEERERQAEERIQYAELSRQAEAYKGTLAEAVTKDHKHVSAYLSHSRAETLEALANLAGTVMKQDPEAYADGLPVPAEIVDALEQSLAEELAWVRPLYEPPPAPVAQPAAPKPQPIPADEQEPAPKTLSGARLAPKTQPRTKAVTDEEKIARAVKRIAELGA